MECVVLIGLQGSGKTTFYRQWFADTHLHVSKDLWPNARQKEARQHRMLTDAFARGESVVVDNTNPTREERARIIDAARQYGARVVGYYFDTSTRAAVARNATREGKQRVPNVAIFTTAKKLQAPALDEGFDQLFTITFTGPADKTITEVTPA